MKRQGVSTATPRRGQRRAIAAWLLAVAAMVFMMIILGGLTRLTHSGLSMVEWRPLTGWLPPLSEAEWLRVFAAYQQTPEYHKVNAGMDLAGFKAIFWLEFVHRLWGRLIGLVFVVPFVIFALRGWIDRPLVPRLIVLFVLGGLQGALGWYMVASGLVDRPDVSQYRLVAHFGVALVILAAILWIALGLLSPPAGGRDARRLRGGIHAILALVSVTALSGGFVAGIDAGFAYNTFPLMDGELIPSHLFALQPLYLNVFEDVTTVQFTHRVLALTSLAAVIVFWLRSRGLQVAARTRFACNALVLAGLAQVGLGIATLLLIVPVAFASLHQAGAVVLLMVAVWVRYEVGTAAAATDLAEDIARQATVTRREEAMVGRRDAGVSWGRRTPERDPSAR